MMALSSSPYTLPHVKHLNIVRAISVRSLGGTCIAWSVMNFSAHFMCLERAAFASDVSFASCLASVSSRSFIEGGSLRNTGM